MNLETVLMVPRSSQARIEEKLDKLVAEIRAGKRDGSVISSHTVGSLSKHDQETWRQLREELQDMGIPLSALNEHRHFITNWLKKAIEDHVLEEQAPEGCTGESLGEPTVMVIEQKSLPWMPLPRRLTSPTFTPVEERPKLFNGEKSERIVEYPSRPQSARSNRVIDKRVLHTRVNSFLSKLSLLDIQLRKDKERTRNEEIERQIERERSMQGHEVKLLLFGISLIISF